MPRRSGSRKRGDAGTLRVSVRSLLVEGVSHPGADPGSQTVVDISVKSQHLAIEINTPNKYKCHCGAPASRLARCKKCKDVIARCSAHGTKIFLEAGAHACPRP